MAPATGKTIEVKMVGDAKGYHFEPSAITLKAGDAIKFINVIGFPHNVGFDPATTPADVQPQLAANMPGEKTLGALEGPLMMTANETYVISFANIKPGTYNFHCTPHLALGMKGTITVQ
jgi:plastocyanin